MGTTKMKRCVRAVCAPRHLGYALGMRRKFAMSVYVFLFTQGKRASRKDRMVESNWARSGELKGSAGMDTHTYIHTQAKKIIPKVG